MPVRFNAHDLKRIELRREQARKPYRNGFVELIDAMEAQ